MLLENFRKTRVIWDRASQQIQEFTRASSSDNHGRKLSVTVTDEGREVNLTGSTLSLYWETNDKTGQGLDYFVPVDITKGQFEIYYTPEMLSNIGYLKASLVLIGSSGRIVSEAFRITVFKGIDEGAVVGQSSFTALTEALAQVGELEKTYAPRLNAVEINKADKAEVNNLAAQLAQNVNYIEEKNKDMKGDLISDFVRLGNLQTFKDAVAKGYCRIAWFGDSYFGGGDYVDVNDRHVEQYQQILKNAYPNVNFEFANFGVGGRTIENAVDSGYTSPDDFEISWANVAGKSWRNYVKDYNPHLVFICFGMNVPTGGGKKTSYYMEQLRTWINTWTNTPSLVFLNSPIPNKSWAADWKEREIASRQISLFCKKNNFSLIDAFNKYRTLVDGLDENKTTKARHIGLDEIILNGQIHTTKYQAKDFKFTATITLTGSNAFSVYFRSGGSIVVDANKIIGTGIPTINLDGSTGTFELTVELGDNLKIKINDTTYYDGEFYEYVLFSEIAFGYSTGSGSVSNITIISNHPNHTSAGFTVEDFYGKYIAGDFGLKLPTGGNGVNHPSSIGYNYFYVPLIYEFINKFNSIFKKESTVQKTFNLTLSNDLVGYSYTSLPAGVTVPYLGGVLESPEGTIFEERKDVFWIINPPTVFSGNEYLVRRAGAITQLLLPRQTTLTGWKYTTNVLV